ncbi:hypothetical protein [Cereibacter sphaeroides]|uniref:hypothetical protein n=1 Tax=Cereibacter sphaeroides TaxID=1063 RepID=UPI0015F80770|nr:hypothetical protein [Cereibacter sphaeroides]
MPCLIIKKWLEDQSFRHSRTQGEAEERNFQWTFRRPNADIARAVSLGRRGM